MFKEMPYVYAVYKERGFAKAAKSLHITQPVVSIMVKRAEEEFNAPIFNRTNSPITLTAEGIIYIKAIEQIMGIENETLSLYNSSKSPERQQLRIGASSLLCTYILPPVVLEFKKEMKDIYSTWTEAHSKELLRLLRIGEVDFVLEADDFDPAIFESVIWGKEYLLLAVPSDEDINNKLIAYRYTNKDISEDKHKQEKKFAPLEAFSEENFIFLKEGNDISMRSLMLCKRAGFQPHIAMKVDQLMTAYNLSKEKNGLTFIPDNIPKFDNEGDKLYFYIIDSPLMNRNIKLYRKRLFEKNTVTEAFWDFIKRKNQ